MKAESITLRDDEGQWLGQIVLTDDGMFASVTDWGNFSFAWRSFGDDFKEFLLSINVGYFAQTKMNKGAGLRYAEKILPALQKHLLQAKAMKGEK